MSQGTFRPSAWNGCWARSSSPGERGTAATAPPRVARERRERAGTGRRCDVGVPEVRVALGQAPGGVVVVLDAGVLACGDVGVELGGLVGRGLRARVARADRLARVGIDRAPAQVGDEPARLVELLVVGE